MEFPSPDEVSLHFGEPALHRAARLGRHDAIRKLVTAGADVNAWWDIAAAPGRTQLVTPLMIAAGSGQGASVETMRLLVELGADPKVRSDVGNLATSANGGIGWQYPGDDPRFRFALELGADPNEQGHDNRGILAAAARAANSERVRLLLAAGANPNPTLDASPRQSMSDELIAGMGFSPAMIDPAILFRSGPHSFQVPLLAAVEANDLESVRALLAYGAQRHVVDSSRCNAFFFASSAEMTRLLVEEGLDIEARNAFDWTPLMSAAGESLEKTAALLAAGANPNATCDRGFTVFMHAASGMERRVEILELLRRSGADPFAISELGFNALHAAVDVNGEANSEASVRSIMTYLTDLGVPLDARNKRGETPLERAQCVGTEVEVKVLSELLRRT